MDLAVPAQPPQRRILHLDMDAFFASVEALDDPSLRGRPLLVGGPGKRGVVAAASYEARPFGVHSAMPMVEALRRCPEAVVVAPRHMRYAEVSRSVFAIFRRFTPLVEGLSVDEAFLDVTESAALFGDGETIAWQIKRAIRGELGLTASAGVARCKFAAKVASDLEKPDGLVVVPDDVAGFLEPLPIERMWGVGPKASARLRGVGLRTIGDLARADPARLAELLGPSWGEHVHSLARGLDDRAVQPEREAVSVGGEETFDEDLTTRESIELRLLHQAARVARRLVEAGLAGRVVVVKVKYSDFTLRTRTMTLAEPIADTDSIYRAARQLLDRIELRGRRVRLIGIAVTGLDASANAQRDLFRSTSVDRRRKLEQVVAEVRRRFRGGHLKRAALLGEREVDEDESS